MTNPYESPRYQEPRKSPLFFFGVVLLIIGVAMPILGLAGTIAGMMYTVGELSEAETPSADSVASGISFSLSTTVVGLIIGVLAAILGGVLIFLSRRRDRRPPS